MRLIDADNLSGLKFVGNKFVQIGGRSNGKTLEAVNRAYQQGWNDAIDVIINNIPTVERPQGEWIDHSEDEGYLECSICGCLTSCNKEELHYCWNCGADMRGGTELCRR